jgi:ribosomal protein L10
VKGVYLEGKVHGDDYFERLALIPSKEVLLKELLYLTEYPIAQLYTVLSGMFLGLVSSLEAIARKKEEG